MKCVFKACWILGFMLLLLKNETKAQEPLAATVKGFVTNENGKYLQGVTVRATNKLTNHVSHSLTDSAGLFVFKNLLVNNQYNFEASFVGYVTGRFDNFEVKQGQTNSILIRLESSNKTLQELVVVGYGVQKKVNVTGAIAVVSKEDLEGRPITNSSQALQGVQGVYVNQAGGQPGADGATIRIRGMGSIGGAGKLNPLVLVDGVEYNLNDINPNDIESISVLKDAASSAIYGSRAANGVILVTTKMGKKERSNIEYNNYFGMQEATYLPDPVDNSVDFMEAYNKAMVNQGGVPYYSEALINEFRTNPTSLVHPNTNWMTEMFKPAFVQEHNLRISGGTEKNKYSLSGGYLDQDGVLKGMTGAKRYSLNLKLNSQVTKRLNVDGSVMVTRWNTDQPADGITTIMNRLNRMVPIQPAGRMENGNWPDSWVLTPGQNSFQNPLIWAEESWRKEITNRLLANIALEYKIFKDLTYMVRGAVSYGTLDIDQWYPEVMMYDVKTGAPKRYWNSVTTRMGYHNQEQRLSVYQTFSYKKDIGNHSFNVMLGSSVDNTTWHYLQATKQGFPALELQEISLGTANPQAYGSRWEDALLSYFGRIQYNYKDKYLFEANSRYDGSSRFADGNRWGLFPSFSAGWRISRESFMDDVKWVKELKLRTSWGQIGNQEIGRFQYVNAVNPGYGYPFGGIYNAGSAIVQSRDASLSWETTTITNVGLEWSLFDGKLSGEAEWFRKRTDGILRTQTLPDQVGALDGPVRNMAVVDNTGYEIGISHTNKIGSNFSYNLSAYITKIRNEVVDLQGEVIIDAAGARITKKGYPIDSWYVLKTDGLFQTQEEVKNYPVITNRVGPGDVKYVDLNGDKVINGDDRYIAGNTFPEYTYSFNAGVKFKGFSLQTFWQGVENIAVRPNGNMASPFNNGAGLTKNWLTDSWTPQNTTASLPRITTRHQYTAENFSDSDFWLKDASYLRLKNIQLSYDFPSALIERMGIKKCRLFVNGQNLITFTKVKYFDPERTITQNNFDQYPTVKMFTAGLNITL